MDRTTPALRAATVVSFALAAFASHAQTISTPPATADDALRAMSDAAGIIFTGTVTAVRHPPRPDGTPGGIVQVDFAVADAIRGVTGPAYTLKEWAGLWAANDQPLRVGQRYLMLLHAPNAAGITSPVAGTDGAIPIRGVGPAATPDGPAPVVSPTSGVASSAAATIPIPTEVVDLGWVATHVAVPVVYAALHAVSANPIPLQANARGGSLSELPANQVSGLPSEIPAETRSVPYHVVLETLRRWEAADALRR